jgi:hypothetical protein
MKYSEIDTTDANRTTSSDYPYNLELRIDPLEWHRFVQLSEDSPGVRIVGHDDPRDGLITVRLACASKSVQKRMWDAW